MQRSKVREVLIVSATTLYVYVSVFSHFFLFLVYICPSVYFATVCFGE